MPSVLIIDDEPNIRRMVGALLAAEGYEVRDAPDGASGLARARESVGATRPIMPRTCCIDGLSPIISPLKPRSARKVLASCRA